MIMTSMPILLYHAVQPQSQGGTTSGSVAAARQFESQMQWLQEHGYRVVPLADLAQHYAPDDIRRNKTLAITFDDGYHDFLTLAFPILCRYRFTATVFLVADQLGQESNWEGAGGQPLLSWDQARELSHGGISFGSHTSTHPRLLQLPAGQVRNELADSRKRLETELDREISILAYPYGESNAEIQTMAAEAGYTHAYGVMTGDPGPFNLWRREIDADESTESVAAKLTNRYLYANLIRKWLREDTAPGRYLRTLKHRAQSRSTKVE